MAREICDYVRHNPYPDCAIYVQQQLDDLQADMLAALKAIGHRGEGRISSLRSFMEHNAIPYGPTEAPSEWMARIARWMIAKVEGR